MTIALLFKAFLRQIRGRRRYGAINVAGLSPRYFADVVIMAVFVATLTVLSQTLRVARAEPARALRAE